MATFIAD